MKKLMVLLMMAVLAVNAFAGGGGEALADESTEVVLRWRTRPDNQEEIAVYQQISDELSAQLDGITLIYEPGGSESSSYQDVLKTELAGGTAPDLFWIPGTDVADFVKRDLLLDMRSLANASNHNDSDFYPGPMYHLTYNPETGRSGETLWGLPRDVSTFALYLNLDLIAEAGAPDPRELARRGQWTWEAFFEVMRAIDALGDDIYGYGQNAWWGPAGVWAHAAGGGFFTDDRTASNMHTDESLEGLAFQRQFYEAGYAVPWGEDSEPPFRAGRVGMFQNGRWATPGMRSGVNFDWDVVELPTGPSGSARNWLFWGAYVVNQDTEHPEAAFRLLQALTSAETQAKIAALGANIPSRVSQEALDSFLTFTPPENNQAFLNGLADNPVAEGPLWEGNWPEFDAVLGARMSAVLTGDISLEEFANSIQAELDRTFD
jgi:multiple sugar transport system substrate-binding protein